jgi:H+/Cl- antiporter ClcA
MRHPSIEAPRLDSIEHADSNRNLAVSLGGTCIAILVFVLFFLYGGSLTGQFDPVLFQVTLVNIIVAGFLFGYAGTCYFTLIALVAKARAEAEVLNRRGFLFFVLGTVLLSLEPTLITLTLRLWVVLLALVVHSGREWAEVAKPG